LGTTPNMAPPSSLNKPVSIEWIFISQLKIKSEKLKSYQRRPIFQGRNFNF
jgi:hypothetical protein